MAERVRGRGSTLSARLARVSRGTWLVLLLAGGLITALVTSLLATHQPASVSAELHALPKGSTADALRVTYQLDRPPRTEVRCQINALGKDHGVVGTLMDVAPASTGTNRQVLRTVTVQTRLPGVSAEIIDCHITANR